MTPLPVLNLLIIHWLDTLELTQEKEKSAVAQCSTGCLKKFLDYGDGILLTLLPSTDSVLKFLLAYDDIEKLDIVDSQGPNNLRGRPLIIW